MVRGISSVHSTWATRYSVPGVSKSNGPRRARTCGFTAFSLACLTSVAWSPLFGFVGRTHRREPTATSHDSLTVVSLNYGIGCYAGARATVKQFSPAPPSPVHPDCCFGEAVSWACLRTAGIGSGSMRTKTRRRATRRSHGAGDLPKRVREGPAGEPCRSRCTGVHRGSLSNGAAETR